MTTSREPGANPVLPLTRRRFIGMGAGVVVSGSLLAACGGDDEATSGGQADGDLPGQGKTIGFAVNGVNEFTLCLATGIIEASQDAGYDFVGINSNFDAASEPSSFDKLISQGVDGIIVIPVTSQSAARGVMAATQADIPVVHVAWETPTSVDDEYVGRVKVDNVQGGRMIADWLGENAEPGELIVVEGVEGNDNSDHLLEGLTAGVAELGSPWEIVGTQAGNYTRAGAIQAVEALSAAHPNAKIVVDFASEMGVGIASWRERNNLRDMVSVTSDGNLEMKKWLENGWLTADRYYSAARTGVQATEILRRYLEEGERSGIVPTEQLMVTKENVVETQEKLPLCYDQFYEEAEQNIA